MNYKNEDSRIREIICLGDNWENITDVEVAERFDALSNLDKNAFLLGFGDDEEKLDFFRKVLRGKDREIEKLKEMTRDVIEIAKETQEDRSELIKDWALLSYIRELDIDGDFTAMLVKWAVRWFMNNVFYADKEELADFRELVREHVNRVEAEIERYHGKDSADKFAEKVAGVLA